MKHLLSIDDLSAADIHRLLELTDHMVEISSRPIPKVPALRGKNVVSLFFEDSTRTRTSFDTAAKRLSADTMNFAVSSSSVNKGESLRDTIETIAAMGVDAFVVRHKSQRRAADDHPLDDRQHRQRRRRLAPAPDPGAARLLHDPHQPQPPRRLRRTAHRDRRRHQAQPRRPQRRAGVHRARRPRHAGGSADAAAAVARRLAGRTSATTSTRVLPDLDVLYLLRVQRERMDDALAAEPARVLVDVRPDRRHAPRAWRHTRW